MASEKLVGRESSRTVSFRKVDWGERWASLIAGGALAAFGVSRRGLGGAVLSGLGTGLLYMGVRGSRRKPRLPDAPSRKRHRLSIKEAVTVLDSAEALFSRWRNTGELPSFLSHLKAIHVSGDGTSTEMAGWFGKELSAWRVGVVVEESERRISWRTVEPAALTHWGTVFFRPAPASKGAEVHVALAYEARTAQGRIILERFLREDPRRRLVADLRRYKQIAECGEIATIEGQPRGRGKRSSRLGGALTRRAARAVARRPEEVSLR